MNIVDVLKYQFGFCEYVCRKVMEGVTHAESLAARVPDGSSLNWVLGHVVLTRNHALTLLGEPLTYPEERFTRYRQGSPPLHEGQEALPIEELLAAYRRLHERTMSALDRTTPKKLSAPAPFSPLGKTDETVGSLLVGVACHEAYHLGQAGLLRRTVGKPGAVG